MRNIPRALMQFMPRSQQWAVADMLRESDALVGTLDALALQVAHCPTTYQQDGLGLEAVAHLHYFSGGSDWWITEKDESTDQHQAFGFACLNGDWDCAEWGYISLVELCSINTVELDFYWTPTKLSDIIKSKGPPK